MLNVQLKIPPHLKCEIIYRQILSIGI